MNFQGADGGEMGAWPEVLQDGNAKVSPCAGRHRQTTAGFELNNKNVIPSEERSSGEGSTYY